MELFWVVVLRGAEIPVITASLRLRLRLRVGDGAVGDRRGSGGVRIIGR